MMATPDMLAMCRVTARIPVSLRDEAKAMGIDVSEALVEAIMLKLREIQDCLERDDERRRGDVINSREQVITELASFRRKL